MGSNLLIDSPWTKERTASLKALAADGLSANKIAIEIGGLTRSAVIGKARRMKIPLRNMRGMREPGVKTPPPERRAKKPVQSRPPRLRYAPPAIVEQPTPVPDTEPAKPKVDPFALTGPGVLFMDLLHHHCRWPYSEFVGGPAVFYCGKDSLEPLPYCLGHCSIAYRPADPSRRRTNRR